MIKYIIPILFLTACESNIQINIRASNDLIKTKVEHKDSDIKQVTDKEILLFNITNENLNRGVRVEMGKVPDEIFLKDPTAYGEVFMNYNWPDVKRKLVVRHVKIVEFIKEEIVLKRYEHINNATTTIESKVHMVQPVTNTVTAIWNNAGLPEDAIYYNVTIDFGYGKVLHHAAWRDANTSFFDMTIEKDKGVITIQPGQSVDTQLLADKIILLVEIELDAHLIGNIVANYAHTYGKYHFWAPTIANIMRAAKLKNGITTKFLLEIRYHANARIKLEDKEIIIVKRSGQRKRKPIRHFSQNEIKLGVK